MVGCDKSSYDRAVEVFSVLDETSHYMGVSGAGYVLKLCVNHLVSALVPAVCESMVLALNAGIEPEAILKVWMDSDFSSPVAGGVGNSIISRNFDVALHLI